MSLPETLTPYASPDAGLPPASKPKRERVSKAKRKRALDLAQELMFLGDRFIEPEFQEILNRAVKEVRQLSESTRDRDRDLVLKSLEEWECLTGLEIVEETSLSAWVVKTILSDLITLRLVKAVKQHNPAPSVEAGCPPDLYSLIHTPVGSDFSLPGRNNLPAEDPE